MEEEFFKTRTGMGCLISSVCMSCIAILLLSGFILLTQGGFSWAGSAAAHSSIGATQPSPTWYFAEGSTAGGFETWVLVQNPGTETAQVRLTYHTNSGEVPGPDLIVPPGYRRSVNLGQTVETYEVSTRVDSDQPVVAERATYFNGRMCAHSSIGATQPSPTWYFAEGATAGGFETWVLVQNPNREAVEIKMTCDAIGDNREGPRDVIPPCSRRSYKMSDYKTYPYVNIDITSNGGGVICERAVYFGPNVYTDPSLMIEVGVGEEFAICTWANYTTGCRWQLAWQPGVGVVELIDEYYVGHTVPPPPFCGGGGNMYWVFKAVGAGETIISLEFFPPPEDVTSERMDFMVEVH